MRLLQFLAVLTLFAMLSVGCAGTSPTVGTWTGSIKTGQPAQDSGLQGMATMMLGSMLNGPCTLQLNAGGKGFIKIASLPERPINWSEQEGKVILSANEPPPANAPNTSAQNNSIVGTLAPDKQTLTLDFGVASAELKKQ